MFQETEAGQWMPLSETQRSRWFAYQARPEGQGGHNIAIALRLYGAREDALYVRALHWLAERHPMLRARLRERDGQVEQSISNPAQVAVSSCDARGLDPDALQRQVQADGARPFELAGGSLLRGHLYRCAEQELVLQLVFDHLAADGWSVWRLIGDLEQILAALAAGATPPLLAAPASYADFIAWQRDWLAGTEAASQGAYWRRVLQGSLPVLSLRRRAAVAPGATPPTLHSCRLAPSLVQRLKTQAGRHGQTLYTMLLAGLHVVLQRHTGQQEIVIGSPMPGRCRSEWDAVTGDFVNPVALRLAAHGGSTLAQVLRGTRSAAMGAMAHQEYPFARLVEELAPQRSAGVHPLFQAMFNFQNPRGAAQLAALLAAQDAASRIDWAGHQAASYPVHQSGGMGELDLTLEALELDGEVRCDFKFAADLLPPPAMARLAAHYCRVMEALAGDLAQCVGDIVLMEPDQVAALAQGAPAAPPPPGLAHRVFEAQAAASPDAPAVRDATGVLSYGELNRRANRLAQQLRALGIGPEARVAVHLERGSPQLVAVLGIWKAGAAYVPLDPVWPAQRVAELLADCAPQAVVTQHALRAGLPPLAMPVLELEPEPDPAPWLEQGGQHDLPPVQGEDGGRLAYVIYTSGSSGMPKGVMVEHGALLQLWQGLAPLVARHCAAPSNIALNAALSFDASLQSLLQLLSGHTVVTVPQAIRGDGAALVEFLVEQRIALFDCTPAQLELMVAAGLLRHPGCAGKAALVGGEAIGSALWRQLQQAPLACYNVYGPTECTVDATLAAIDASDPEPHIGRPLGHARIFILDALGRAVPPGVPGEIHIGGPGLARGYLHRPELTAERFIQAQVAGVGALRVYKTGDLACWRESGNIDYLGRNDSQVKIRGYRIETGEIEARLVACAGVRGALVVAGPDAAGGQRLLAYLLAQEGARLAPDRLRAALACQLPDYMLPVAYVQLDAFPLTPNGKLDLNALPAPSGQALCLRHYEAPHGAAETQLAGLWQQLLGVEQAGRHDHFFEAGGHSLLALQLVAQLRQQHGAELALADVFAAPVLADMAQRMAGGNARPLLALQAVPRTPQLPASAAQQRLWFLDRLERAAGAAYHMPAAFHLEGELDVAVLRAALDAVVARHEALRTTFALDGNQPVQVIGAAGAGFALLEHDLRGMPAHEQAPALERIQAEEAAAPFELGSGPLVRGRLLALASRRHVLLITMHHIISDGWSVGVLTREVGELYAALLQGRPAQLPPLTWQYADYAAWQQAALEQDAMQAQLDFWRAHLQGAPAVLELPADVARPARQDYAGGVLAWELPAASAQALRALAQRHGATLFMTLLAGWATLLARLSGSDEVVVGVPVANRGRAEFEQTIGFFVNTLPLRARLDGDMTVAALLAQVRETTLQGYAQQDLPFEQLVKALNPERSLAHNPIFQVALSLDNTPDSGELMLPGLQTRRVALSNQTTQFDLSLALAERGNAIEGRLTYASGVFRASTVRRWMRQFATLLAAMAEHPGQALDQLPWMGETERLQLLHDFNATTRSYPAESLVHAEFARLAAAQPQAPALLGEQGTVSYGELNARANRVAHYLRALGIGPDARVGLCLERGADMIVAMLAVLKAGGAYVPLDAGYPAERLAFMLADSAPAVLLTTAALEDVLPVQSLTRVLLLDDDSYGDVTAVARQPDSDPLVPGLGARNLAYVMYTSGSTGQPKGVMIEHRNVLRLALNSGFAPLTPADRVAHCASPAFDAATWEIWAPLLNGASVLLVPQPVVLAPQQLCQALVAGGATALWLTVGLFNEYRPALGAAFAGLRYLLVGGDALDVDSVRQLLASEQRPQQLINGYGPTESTTFACTHAIEAVAEGARSIPIGKPIGNTQAYILDRGGRPAPLGVVGELFIGGDGVGRGYLNRPELTAERFVDNPFGAGKLYKTGDLVRWLEDGSIEFMGRNDFQVKLRGYRIELGEIEVRLKACEGVREAVVLARDDGHGKRLVAYVVAEAGASFDAAAVRRQLALHLADYMLPAAYVVLDALPLTANGKLARQALPAPDGAALATREYVAPQGEVEQALAQIWQELLGVERVGRHDHFFELGGHSLLAAQVVTAIQRVLHAEVAVRQVFERPTLAGLAAAIEEEAARSRLEAISVADRSQPLPLAWPQQRLWFIEQFDGTASAAYHIPAALHLRGSLDKAALRRALDGLVARHENLRTTFVEADGRPVQRIAAAGTAFALAEDDLSGQDAQQQALRVQGIRAEETAARFDFVHGPLIRGRLLSLSPHEHILLITQHHIITDGWSIGILVRELGALYAAFCQGRPDPLAPLALQFADYAAWQRSQLDGSRLERQIDFWRTHLDGAPALLALPTDYPRPPLQSYSAGTLEVVLPAPLTAALRDFGRRHGATMFMTLMAGWSLLLARLSGQDDVVVGTPIANRTRSEFEALTGFFVNTLALRTRLQPQMTGAQLLAQVKACTLDAYANQEAPFDQVVEAVNPARSNAYSPLFQATLAFNGTPLGRELHLPGLSVSQLPQQHRSTMSELFLNLEERDGEVRGSLEYADRLYSAASMQKLLARWSTLLAAMAGNEHLAVAALPLLDEGERARVLTQFNGSARDYGSPCCMHELFEHHAALAPDAPALACGEQALSYGALNARANRLAHYLRELGVRPNARVALCMEPGFNLVTGLLAILKAGGAYVPLDPAYPSDRLAYMLGDAAPVVLLSETAVFGDLPGVGHVRSVLLDADDFGDLAALARQPDGNLAVQETGLTPDHLAYVIYTSGTTGAPKGVMNHHRGLYNLAAVQAELFRAGPGSRVLQFASSSFDASIWEIVMACCSGAALHLAARADLRPGAPLLELMLRQRISHVTLPSSALAACGDPERLPPTTIVVAGDAFPPALARLWSGRHTVFNAYGPTETTVCATSHRCDPGAAGELPIGRPIGNVQVYILDGLRQPVPVGVAGEIYIGGVGVARGYLNRPELTAERFIDDPFASHAGARLYRSGDIGRWRDDGLIEYLGRNDFQLKVRGFRIEPGEIEARLRACDGVREAVVVARAGAAGDKRLVAYIVADGAAPEAAQLRSELARHLADYMLPSAYVALERLPLTPNGKVDHQALPAPGASAVASRAYAAPQGQAEHALAGIWQDLLGLERVGRHDHFFELGGHSLLAVQVTSQVRALLGVELSLRELFEAPVLASCAALLGAAQPTEHTALALADRGAPLPLSWPQQRLWFLDRLDRAAGAAYHIPLGLRLRGRLDAEALGTALDRIVARHENLRTTFVLEQDEAVQRIAPATAGFALQRQDLGGLAAAEREAALATVAAEEAAAPFDLAAGPLIRGRLLRLGPQEHVLLVTMHHIVSDGWSIGVLVREVSALYAARLQCQDDPLPPLAFQYADYAAWQRAWLQGPALQAQLDYWQERLAGAPALLELPTDRARPALQSYAGGVVEWTLAPQLLARLHAVGRAQDCTLFMTLCAAFNVLLARYSGQDDICVGTPVANRQRGESEGLIGLFINTVVLRTSLAGNPSFDTLLRQVRSTTLDAYAHQEVPFERLVEAIRPQRNPRHSPLFQAMLVLQNAALGELQLPGLQCTLLPERSGSAKFDLTLSMAERADSLHARLEYNSDLFDHATVARMAGHFTRLLEAVAADPTRYIGALDMLDGDERRQLLAWGPSPAFATSTALLHQRFERHAQRTPDAVAVLYAGTELSYAELNRRANRLARHLRTLGAGPEARVAICLERGCEMMVALLAVLKAGAAYVPVDPAVPSERIAFILDDSAPAVVLTDGASRARLPGTTGATVLDLTLDGAVWATLDCGDLACAVQPEHLAYIIYTSGSTGQPKGVMVEHRNMARLFDATDAWFGFGPSDTWTLFHSFAFDFSVWEIWGALAYGGRLVLVAQATARSAQDFYRLLCEHGVTVLNQTPSAFRQLLAAQDAQPQLRHSLRAVVFGGEALETAMLAPWYRRAQNAGTQLVNMYGITETTVHVTYRPLQASDALVGNSSPIGVRIPDLRVYILDALRQPVPLGVTGEMYVGGAGVARGYLNRPELTAERFLDDPFLPGERLYKTGDLARHMANGDIAYVGRNDFQVKLRGYRIELGEIEARLSAMPAVREAVVLVRTQADGERRLVAYLVPSGEGAADALQPAQLRAQLGLQLAEYMVPSAFVLLDAMPLTANGKTDRDALPAPDAAAVSTRAYVAPLAGVEAHMAAIWAELLPVGQVGRHDDFFELGGHSLMATQLMQRVRQACGVDVPLVEIFQAPTLAAFAQRVVAAELRNFGADDVSLNLAELDSLSDQEVERLLEEERRLSDVD